MRKINKIALLICILWMAGIQGFAQTNVSGFISSNTNWTLAGSPYIIIGNTVLDSGFTLTIDPGVIVKFTGAKSLQIDGILHAVGTNTNPITFTSNQTIPAPDDWDYILFTDKSTDYDSTLLTGCIMKYCVVEYAGASGVTYNGAIRIFSSFPNFSNCKIRNNGTVGISVAYSDPGGGLIYIKNCEIENNDASAEGGNALAGGIRIELNTSKAIITNNKISNNKGGTAGGISLSCVNNNTSVVSNNTIINNKADNGFGTGGGLYVSWWGGIVADNIIYGNSAPQGGGLCLNANHGTIRNNDIINNTSSVEGAGIHTTSNYYWPVDVQILNNTIIDNISSTSCGIYCMEPQGSLIKYNTITRNSSTGISSKKSAVSINQYAANNSGFLFNNNNLFRNNGTAPFYQFNNALPQSNGALNANNCWWGTTTTTYIDTMIYDFLDDGLLSVADYTPLALSIDTIAPVTPPVNIVKTDLGGGNIKVTWNANTEADIAGYKIYWGSPTGYSFANVVNSGNVTCDTITGASYTDTIAVTAYDHLMNGIKDQLDGNESWFTKAIGIPVANISAASFSVCVGGSISYTGSGTDVDTWSWILPGGTPSVSSTQNPVVTYLSSGTYTTELIATNSAGSDTVTRIITVNPIYNFNVFDTICNGGIYIFPDGTTSTIATTHTSNLSTVAGCDSIIITHLSVNPTYSINNPQTICDGNSYVFNGHTYTTAATYHDTLATITGCDSIIVTQLTVDPAYHLNLDSVNFGNNDTLIVMSYPATIDAGNGFQYYSWSNGVATQTTLSGGDGWYCVTVTSDAGCTDSACIYVIISIGVDEIGNSNSLLLYPNPNNGEFTLDLSNIKNNISVIKIFDVLGKEINELHDLKKESSFNIDMRTIPDGIYLIKAVDKKGMEYRSKFIKQ